ncbi:flavodoxin [uncultured Bacteroides sp.]|uniref:flavodoxin n=1 Tax=uncultured Bacteroides sp. TaxID=162156 RepID=UPI0026232AB0|nr:flavodoxin [uncultured Bacteroides sp.]
MKKIGLFYVANAVKTSQVARKIREALGADQVDIIPAEKAWGNDFQSYDNLVIGASTWFDGELPTFWDELVPELTGLDLKGKKVALFGLGDQVNYPDNFVDGLGILAEEFEKTGAILVGYTSAEGYTFNRSKALRDDQWCGLVIDVENQSKLSDKRIKEWCEQLKKEF